MTPSPSSDQHHRLADRHGPVPIAVVTVSDSRTAESDSNGLWLREQIQSSGHHLAGYRLIRDEPDQVEDALATAAASGARVVVFNGGTGIAPRDTTYDVLARRIERPLPGFGELFRMLSWEQVGAAAMLSRATAGVCGSVVVFSLPGSHAAVQLAWQKLIAPELRHVAWLVEG
jgi:molybdopterin adenylyltransferase